MPQYKSSSVETNALGSRLYAETTANFLAVHLWQNYSNRKLTLRDHTDGLPKSRL
jgi:hypothetical protein